VYRAPQCTSTIVDHFDADPDPAFHFIADPDPAFHFDAVPDPAFHFNAVAYPALHFDSDPDPQHWYTIEICVSVMQYAMFFYGTYETGFVKKTEVRS
jgi:hypothetical protein